MFRYHDIRASSYCKLPKCFCSSKTMVNIQKDDNYCSLWPSLAHKYKVENHQERVSHYEKHFHERNQGDIQFPMKVKHIPIIERLNNININVFELSANDKILSSKCVKKTIMMNR